MQATSINGSAYVNVNPLPEAVISAYPQPANILNPQINFTDESNGHINEFGILMMELHNLPILIRFLIFIVTQELIKSH